MSVNIIISIQLKYFLLLQGLSQNAHKKLRFLPGIIFIDGKLLKMCSEAGNEKIKRLDYRQHTQTNKTKKSMNTYKLALTSESISTGTAGMLPMGGLS